MRLVRSRVAFETGMAVMLLSASAGPAAAQTIVGRVTDAQTGAAISRARISVTGTFRRGSQRAIADDDGRFTVRPGGVGIFRVQATRTGYGTEYSDPVPLGPNDTVRVDLRLRPGAVALPGVTATSRPRRLPVRGKFDQTGVMLPVTAAARSHAILAQGTFVTPNSCYRLAGVADRQRSVVTLYIDARPDGEYCAGGPTAFKYTATVRRLAPGSYTFRILYVSRGSEWKPVLALDTTIVVPEQAPRRR